jgi:hypothetical protein
MASNTPSKNSEEFQGVMNDEFDYELTPDQWEALKNLRNAASRPARMNRFTIDSLIVVGLRHERRCADHHVHGTQGAGEGLVAAAARSGRLIAQREIPG